METFPVLKKAPPGGQTNGIHKEEMNLKNTKTHKHNDHKPATLYWLLLCSGVSQEFPRWSAESIRVWVADGVAARGS